MSVEELPHWASQIANYVRQMNIPENTVKIEVLEDLHGKIGKCLAAWRRDEQEDMLKLAEKARLTPKQKNY